MYRRCNLRYIAACFRVSIEMFCIEVLPLMPNTLVNLYAEEGASFCRKEVSRRVLKEINIIRGVHRLTHVANNSLLQIAANKRATELAYSGELSHDGWIRTVKSSGYHYQGVSENIAVGHSTADRVVRAWYNSPGHRKNMLQVRFQETAVSCVRDSRGKHWWVQLFGTPLKER